MATEAQQAFAEAVAAQRSREYPTIPHVIGGVERHEGELRHREDPSNTAATVCAFYDAPDELVLEAVQISRNAQREWRRVPLAERLERMRPALEYIEANAEEWAVRVALEIGKPYAAALAEGIEIRDMLRYHLQYAAAPGAFEDERDADPAGLSNDSGLLKV